MNQKTAGAAFAPGGVFLGHIRIWKSRVTQPDHA
jgi:hypothetical protein